MRKSQLSKTPAQRRPLAAYRLKASYARLDDQSEEIVRHIQRLLTLNEPMYSRRLDFANDLFLLAVEMRDQVGALLAPLMMPHMARKWAAQQP